MRRTILIAAALTLGIGATSCSSSGSTTTKSAANAPTTGSANNAGGTCAPTKLTATVDGKPFTATSSAAVSLDGGKGYTMYLADFPVKADDITMLDAPKPAAGQTMMTVFDTVFNAPDPAAVKPVKAGDKTAFSPDFGKRVFKVIAQAGEKPFQSDVGGKGTLTVTKVGDEFCGTIDYKDDEKSIKGTFQAPVKAL